MAFVFAMISCAVVVLGLFLYDRSPLHIEVNEVAEVEVHLSKIDKRQNAADVITHDAAAIQELLTEVGRGVRTEDHKCGESGRIVVHRTDGSKIRIGILAGHYKDFYEFRVFASDSSGYRIFRSDRASFLRAMAKLGLPELDAGLPE